METMRNGTHPHLLDTRDHALHHTFPQFSAVTPGLLIPMDYTLDAGLFVPDQNNIDTRFNPALPALPFGCTGETSTDICADEDKVLYDPQYTYLNTCAMEGHGPDGGCDIRNSMKSLTIYGLRKDGETNEQAIKRKRGKYFTIDKVPGRDWFDSFRLALRGNKRSISVGTPWFGEWGWAGWGNLVTVLPDGSYQITGGGIPTGIMPLPNTNIDLQRVSWHDYKICGEKTINGVPYLIGKPWAGVGFGDKGFIYLRREVFNAGYDIYGTFSATPGQPVAPEDIQYIKLTIYQQILVFVNRLLALVGKQVPVRA